MNVSKEPLLPDLESGTQLFPRSRKFSATVDIVLERLKEEDAILRRLKSKETTLFGKFKRIGHKPAVRCLRLMWYTDACGMSINLAEGTFLDALRDFSHTMSSPRQTGVQLCVAIADSDHLDLKPELRDTPKYVLLEVLFEAWGFQSSHRTDFLAMFSSHEPCLPRWTVQFPSQPTLVDYNIFKSGRTSFDLEWPPSKAPQYLSDLHIYVWQPFARLPELKSARICFQRTQTEADDIRAVIVFKRRDTFRLFQDLYDRQRSQVQGIPNTYHWQIDLLLHLYHKIKSDTMKFLDSSSLAIDQLTFHGRVRPSGGKMQYLLHLKDWQMAAHDACQKNVDILSQILNASSFETQHSTTPLIGSSWIQSLESLRGDLTVLQAEYQKIQTRIDDLHRILNQQLNLASMRRSYLLTVLVGLYVPMSFLASYFGMNITNHTPSTTWKNVTSAIPNLQAWSSSNSGTSTSATPIPSNLGLANSTSNMFMLPQNISYISSGDGTYSWEIPTFWALSIPLAISSIAFPLLAGEFVRKSLRGYERRPEPLQLLLGFYALSCIVLPLTPLNNLLSIFSREWNGVQSWPIGCILILTYQCLGIVPLYLQAYATLRKDSHRRRIVMFWSFLGTLMLVSYLAPFLIVTYLQVESIDGEMVSLTEAAYWDDTSPDSLSWSAYVMVQKYHMAILLLMPWSLIPWAIFLVAWFRCPDWFTSWDDYTSLDKYKSREDSTLLSDSQD